MADKKDEILKWIEDDREKLINFLSGLIQAKSPNPPGDTREAAEFIRSCLNEQGIVYEILSPHPERPNIISSFDCGSPGRHLVFNGHIDVFPVGKENWTYGAWSGAIVDGRIYGRGASDMKCGVTASLFSFIYMHRLRDLLKGRLTLTLVSDEENFGPWGARYVLEHRPDFYGECVLSGDGPTGIVFGDKGLLWLSFKIRTRGAHGAYIHASPSATMIAARLMIDLETLTKIQSSGVENVDALLRRNAQAIENSQGKGAAEVVRKVTVNVGTIQGGVKINMIPGECVMEVDIRLPVGLGKEPIIAQLEKILKRYPEVSYEEIFYIPPNWSEPDGEMVKIIQKNIKTLRGVEPQPIISIGATDLRLWRSHNVPAYLCAPGRGNMGAADEHMQIEELMHLVKAHALSAYDYLNA